MCVCVYVCVYVCVCVCVQVQTLRGQLKEREKQLEQLEKDYSLAKLSWEREEKLVVSAWHEMVRRIVVTICCGHDDEELLSLLVHLLLKLS